MTCAWNIFRKPKPLSICPIAVLEAPNERPVLRTRTAGTTPHMLILPFARRSCLSARMLQKSESCLGLLVR